MLSDAPASLAGERGVYSERLVPSGMVVYYQITSTGALLNKELRCVCAGETAADVERAMWRELDRRDRVTHRRPFLVRR